MEDEIYRKRKRRIPPTHEEHGRNEMKINRNGLIEIRNYKSQRNYIGNKIATLFDTKVIIP